MVGFVHFHRLLRGISALEANLLVMRMIRKYPRATRRFTDGVFEDDDW